jgi:hypothetical protein
VWWLVRVRRWARVLCDAIGSIGTAVDAEGGAAGDDGVIGAVLVCAHTGAAIVRAAANATPFKTYFMGITSIEFHRVCGDAELLNQRDASCHTRHPSTRQGRLKAQRSHPSDEVHENTVADGLFRSGCARQPGV